MRNAGRSRRIFLKNSIRRQPVCQDNVDSFAERFRSLGRGVFAADSTPQGSGRSVQAHGDPRLRHAGFSLPNREFTEMEDRSRQHRAGVALLHALDEMVEIADAA
jgi:hypothetical protein